MERTKEKISSLVGDAYPGVDYRFIKPDEHHILGLAQLLPTAEALTEEMLFDVASLTKVVCTTTVILKLWERGVLQFDEPLRHFLPTFQEGVTIRHLLTHTSGVAGYIPHRDQLTASALRQAYLALQTPQLPSPVKYTDTGTILLGFMLEEIFQQDVATIFQEEVLTPLGMTKSRFEKVDPAQAVASQYDSPRGPLRGTTHDPKAFILGAHAGNAGLFTTSGDLLHFSRMLLQRGWHEGPFLKEETVLLLLEDQTPDKQGGRSLGWDLKGPYLYHTGYTGTFLLLDPLQEKGLIFLSNRVHPYDHRAAYLKKRDEIIETFLQESTSGVKK